MIHSIKSFHSTAMQVNMQKKSIYWRSEYANSSRMNMKLELKSMKEKIPIQNKTKPKYECYGITSLVCFGHSFGFYSCDQTKIHKRKVNCHSSSLPQSHTLTETIMGELTFDAAKKRLTGMKSSVSNIAKRFSAEERHYTLETKHE